MAKSPAFQFYPDSWLSSLDITLMTPAEEGAYIRLLCHAWLSPDCGLPADANALKTLSRLGSAWSKSEGVIKAKFREEGGRLFNDRLLLERTKQMEWREKSANGGKRSGETRREANREPNSKGGSRVVDDCLQPKPNTSSSSPSPSPVTTQTPFMSPADAADKRLAEMGWEGVSKTSEEVCSQIAALSLEEFPESRSLKSAYMIICRLCWFDDFWAFYWRHDDKRKARVKYFEKVTSHELQEIVENAVIAQAPEMLAREKQHRKLAATWLHGECWMNQPTLLDGSE